MAGDRSTDGDCPECGEATPEAWVLVEYETEAGSTGRWAEFPGCHEVVAPE